MPLAETATFNPALARMAAESSAREATYVGVQWTYAPMADIARDPRWGRIIEGAGEDPYLARVFTTARVEGLHAGGLATGVKHFAGYGAAAGGRDYDATDIPPAEFRDVFLPPFRAAVEAGTDTVMSAFNALNGVPATANPWLLTGILRNEWGFTGFVVSDWAAIHELIAHGIAEDGAEAARKAFLAGVDMDLAGGLYDLHLADEVRAGRVPGASGRMSPRFCSSTRDSRATDRAASRDSCVGNTASTRLASMSGRSNRSRRNLTRSTRRTASSTAASGTRPARTSSAR